MLQTSSVIRNKIRYTAIGTSWVHTCKGFEGQSLSAPMATLLGSILSADQALEKKKNLRKMCQIFMQKIWVRHSNFESKNI